MSQAFTIRPLSEKDRPEWRRMRLALWPKHDPREIDAEIAEFETGGRVFGQAARVFVAERRQGTGLCGFVEVTLRAYADGCASAPVGYLEGWYVDPDARRGGVGRALVDAAEQWARGRGCSEMGSDCDADNVASFTAHQRLGYLPTQGIRFWKPLADAIGRDQTDCIAIVEYPLLAESIVRLVTDGAAGGIDVFLGTTRAETSPQGKALVALDYEAYREMALKQLHELARSARQRWPITRLAIVHRLGRVAIAEPSVIIAVSTPHRVDAFEACRWIIDALKKDVAIWKKEVWDDGSGTWVHPVQPAQ
jgi:molybdopterin synthase catalytic subunit